GRCITLSTSVAVVMFGAVGADKSAGSASLVFDQLGGVLEVAAGALDRLERGKLSGQPVGNDLGQDTLTLAERAGGVKAPLDGLANERRLVRQLIQDFRQVLINAK